MGRVPLLKLTAEQLQRLLNEKRASGLSASTVQRIHATLRRALNLAGRWGAVPRNVATPVDVPKGEKSKPKPLNVREAQALIRAARGTRLEALVTLALATRLRKGKLRGLRWEDVDLEVGKLTVRGQLQRIRGDVKIVPTKSDRSNRTLNLPGFVTKSLRRHQERQADERTLADENWIDWDVVFASPVGTPMEERNVTRQFHRLLGSAGLRPIRFHDLRHSCASFLYAQNIHPRVVVETLGHSQISVTMDLYGHMLPSLQEEAAEKFDRLLGVSPEAVDAQP